MEKLFAAGKNNHLQMVVKDGEQKYNYYILGKTRWCLFVKFKWQWFSKSRSLIGVRCLVYFNISCYYKMVKYADFFWTVFAKTVYCDDKYAVYTV